MLKHPLRTAVAVNEADFSQFKAQENMHIVISAKDFKSIVAHADTLDTDVGAYYSTPGRPLQFSYFRDGMHCQFTLMTVADYNGTPAPSTAASAVDRHISRAPSTGVSAAPNGRIVVSEMPPPAAPNARRPVRKLGQNGPQAGKRKADEQDQESDSLFVPREDDDREDRRWDPAEYENDEETLGWDASANNVREAQDTTGHRHLTSFSGCWIPSHVPRQHVSFAFKYHRK